MLGDVNFSICVDSLTLCADLLEACTARLNGYQGRDGFDVLSDMREAIAGEADNGEV